MAGRWWRRLGVVVTWRVAGCCAPRWGEMVGQRWQRLGVAVTRRVAGCCAPCQGGMGVGCGWGLACHVEAAWQGLAHRVEAAWWVSGVLRDMAGSWRVLGRGGGESGRSESAGGRVLRTMLGWRGGWWQLGLACHVEVAWWVSGVLACHVGLARWVGGGGAGWKGFVFSRVLCAMLGWQGGLAVAECQGRMEVARVHEWPATSKVLRAVLGGRVGSGGVLQAMSGWRVGAGTNGSGSRAQGDSNGLQR
ncbi:hypothetical protein EDB83DRAFT_2316743 [Lactarius deliciosus]|nr:hypothetical protein EDB83DRAFT_2316743 [Lactarius deliciosus]